MTHGSMQSALLTSLSALVLSVALVGCAPAGPPDEAGLGVEPFATRPHLNIRWRQLLNPSETFEYRPREYAQPHYRPRSDEMFVGTDEGTIFKVRGGDGKLLWEKQLDGSIHAEPVFGDGRVYVGTLDGHFYALDEGSGEIIWHNENGAAIEAQAAFAEGRVFYSTTDNVLIAADAATGKSLWDQRRSVPEYFTLKGTSYPVADDGVVYAGFADGVMAAFQLDTGDVLWRSDLSGGKTEFIDVDVEPILAGSRIYSASYDGGLYAVDRDTGEYIWRRPMGGVADVIYGEDELYVASASGRVMEVNAEDGEPSWSFRLEEHTPVALTATRLYVFVSSSSGPIYVLDRASGMPLVTWNPSTGFNAKVVIGREQAFAFSNKGYLYGLDVAY
ncbi:MAG: PQQ-binding-like beta-propeller repeat protein [Persicimonas sp.]